MKNIIAGILMVLFVAGGAFGASFLKSSMAAKDTPEASSAADAHAEGDEKGDAGHAKKKKSDKGKKEKKGDKSKKGTKKKKGDKGGKHAKDGDDAHAEDELHNNTSFLKFSRQFIVPVINSAKVEALIIMSISLETENSASDLAYAMQPKLRDAMTRTLLKLSSEGLFDDDMTHPRNIESLRVALKKAGRTILGDKLKSVLILDMARQDQ